MNLYVLNDIKAKSRFYVFFNKEEMLPETIPMDILTMLQYVGLYNKKEIKRIHAVFPKIKTMEQGLRCVETKRFLLETHAITNIKRKDNSEKLSFSIETLFEEERNFKSFYTQYVDRVKHVAIFAPYPRHYYFSLAYTASIWSQKNHSADLHVGSFLETSIGIVAMLKKGVIKKENTTLSRLFYELALDNQIEIGAIPHMYRTGKKMSALFEMYGMEYLLPLKKRTYNPVQIQNIEVTILFAEKHIRQFLNYAAFNNYPQFEQKVRGKGLHKLNKYELMKLWDEEHEKGSLLTFSDKDSVLYTPVIYTNYNGVVDLSQDYLFLNEFGENKVHVFLKNGQIIDNTGYKEVFFYKKKYYIGLLDGNRGFQCTYNPETHQLQKKAIYVDKDAKIRQEKKSKPNIIQ